MAPSRKSKKRHKKANKNNDLIQKIQKETNTPKKVNYYTTQPPLIPLLNKPIPNLKIVPLSTPSECEAFTFPLKPAEANPVDPPHTSNSPHVLSAKTDNPETNLPGNPTPISVKTTADAVKQSLEEMTKKRHRAAKRLAAFIAAKKQKIHPSQAFIPQPGKATMQNPNQAFIPGPGQVPTQAFIPGPGHATMQFPSQALIPGPGQASMQVPTQTSIPGPGQASVQIPTQTFITGPGQGTMQFPAQDFIPGPAQAAIQVPTQAFIAGPSHATMQFPNQPFIPEPDHTSMEFLDQVFNPTPGQANIQVPAEATMQLPGQLAMQFSGQATMHDAPKATVQDAIEDASIPIDSIDFEAGQPFGPSNPNLQLCADQTKSFNNQQKKRWLRFQQKLWKKRHEKFLKSSPLVPVPEERPLPEMSQDGSPNVISLTEVSATPPPPVISMDRPNQGSSIPVIQKPNITLNMKKSIKQESVPGTSGTTQDAPQTVDAPVSVASVPGSTIPTLENRTVEPVPRSSAGSFFKKAQPAQTVLAPTQPIQASAQPSPAPKVIKTDPYGIPRSFLLQQEKSLEAGGAPITSDSPIWPVNPNPAAYQQLNAPTLAQQPADMGDANMNPTPTLFIKTENTVDVQQPYSPSDIYSEQGTNSETPDRDTESSEQNQSGPKRLSAFQRLGPVSQPKKPKLTINLNLKKEQPVREVVNETDDDPDKYTPVHLRKNIITSTDETVVKFLPFWPWRKNVAIRKSATARNSRSVMILEQEKMEESYEKDHIFIQISVKGYPSTWTKERVLDAVLDTVKGYSLIPCFTEFYQHECKFLVLRSRSALIVLHKTGFYIHKDGVELAITISIPMLTDLLNFIPRIILRKRMVMGYADRKLNLSAFTMQDDISHFIYFPLNYLTNQSDCIQLLTSINWDQLVGLDLSHNRLTTISGFDLANMTRRLKHLDLSHNRLEKITVLLNVRQLPLKTLRLEGNPLCHDYIDPDHYIRVIRMMFPAIAEIDGVPIHRKGDLPKHKQNFCPEEAQEVSEKFLEIFFPLLDSGSDHRSLIQGMYDDDASLTVTYCYKLRYGQIYRNFRNLFLYARFLDEGETDSVVGAMAITKLINRWPHTEHDPFTFTVDALYHTENTTILRIGGVLKLTAETLADDEHLLSFTRTVVLHSEDGAEYKIHNEMVYWDEPTAAAARAAFRVNTISQKNFNLKIEATTDEDLRDKYLKIFMKLTTMDKDISERCLEVNNWNFKLALEHFTKLLKLNNLDSLTQEVQVVAGS